MENKKPFEELAEVWKRVEAARPKLEGSAELMPRNAAEAGGLGKADAAQKAAGHFLETVPAERAPRTGRRQLSRALNEAGYFFSLPGLTPKAEVKARWKAE